MMRVSVDYQEERLELEIPAERLVGSWGGPPGMARPQELVAIRDALDQPCDFPPLRQMIVPGDRVTIAVDPTIAHPQSILEVLGQILHDAGVEPQDVTVLARAAQCIHISSSLPQGSALAVHDAGDRGQLAYLAATKQGRRIYLNRHLTDADVVIPVGRLGFDPIMGYRGPWSVLFPELSDRAAIEAHRGRFRDEGDDLQRARANAVLGESFEVSWLLGSQFHLGVVPGAPGLVAVIAGREQAVRERGVASLESNWTFAADSRAELVVVGIGSRSLEATIDDLGAALATAVRLVQRGGKIVVLSRVAGPIGPAVRSLLEIDNPRARAAALRGREGDEDFVAGRRLAQALAWADVFVLSRLEPDLVDDLSMIVLENPEQARRLVAQSGSCSFVSSAELTRALVREEDENYQDDDGARI